MKNYAHHWLAREGLLNLEAPDLGGLQPRTRSAAYCTSRECTRFVDEQGRIRYKASIRKDTIRDTCPDCGYYIMWR